MSDGELAALYEADQRDRELKRPVPEIVARDAERRVRTRELIELGRARTADDFFHAAMIFQHGSALEDIERAHALALRAVALDPMHRTARWLVAASEDRALMRRDLPQRWGTQWKLVDGWFQLWPVDEATTDAERAEENRRQRTSITRRRRGDDRRGARRVERAADRRDAREDVQRRLTPPMTTADGFAPPRFCTSSR